MFWRRKKTSTADARYERFRAELERGGWHPWPPPNTPEPFEAWRLEWEAPIILRWSTLDPVMNVAGLYWRPLADIIDVTPGRTSQSTIITR